MTTMVTSCSFSSYGSPVPLEPGGQRFGSGINPSIGFARMHIDRSGHGQLVVEEGEIGRLWPLDHLSGNSGGGISEALTGMVIHSKIAFA
jgi:hypothetical protein